MKEDSFELHRILKSSTTLAVEMKIGMVVDLLQGDQACRESVFLSPPYQLSQGQIIQSVNL